MGTISARDCLRVLQLTEQVAAASLLAATQGLELRIRQNDLTAEELTAPVAAMKSAVFSHFTFVDEDRALETDLRHTIDLIQRREWRLFR
jgi:histidine ammonia-lyase